MCYICGLVDWIDRLNDGAGKLFSFLVAIMIVVLVYEVREWGNAEELGIGG